jgi:phage gp29-like protein
MCDNSLQIGYLLQHMKLKALLIFFELYRFPIQFHKQSSGGKMHSNSVHLLSAVVSRWHSEGFRYGHGFRLIMNNNCDDCNDSDWFCNDYYVTWKYRISDSKLLFCVTPKSYSLLKAEICKIFLPDYSNCVNSTPAGETIIAELTV